ncbi:hypothetical protein [Streptomyces sp. NPDC059874]
MSKEADSRVHSAAPRRSGRPGSHERRRTFTVSNRDGEQIFDITIVIKER